MAAISDSPKMELYFALCSSLSVPLWVAPLLHAASRLRGDPARRRKAYRLIQRRLVQHGVGCGKRHKPTYVYPAEVKQLIRAAFPEEICDYRDPQHQNVVAVTMDDLNSVCSVDQSFLPSSVHVLLVFNKVSVRLSIRALFYRKFVQRFENMPNAKSDMDRVGLFKEMGYISIGDNYRPFIYRPFNEAAPKNKQMLVSGPKKKSALQAGYFDKQFKRIFENEALTDLIKIRRQYQMQQAKKNVASTFLPNSGEKKPAGIGSYYGTFGGPVNAMSPLEIPKKTYESPGRNLYTSPPKKGSGYGFPNVTLSKLELYSSDSYDRVRELLKREMAAHKSQMKGGPFRLNLHPQECFNSNPYKLNKTQPPSNLAEEKKTHFAVPFKPSSLSKRAGGMKAGTFDPYPSHSTDPYTVKKLKSDFVSTNTGLKIFRPSPGPKSTPVKSIVSLNVNRFVNSTNYNQVASVMPY